MNQSNKPLVVAIVTAIIICCEYAKCSMATLAPALKNAFSMTDQWVEQCAAAGLLALGCAGLVYGYLSDGYGRRPIMLISVSLFAISSMMMAASPTASAFLIARVGQGLGAGAAWVVGNAVLKDIYDKEDYVKAINQVHSIAGIIPAIAPLIITTIAFWFSWQACFSSLGIFAFGILTCLYWYQPETIQKKQLISLQDIKQKTSLLFSTDGFKIPLIVKASGVAMLYTDINQLPLLLVDYHHVKSTMIGFYLLPLLSAYIFAANQARRNTQKLTTEQFIERGLGLMMLSAALVMLMNSGGETPLELTIACKALGYAGLGFIFGNATAMIVSAVPIAAGLASAFMICTEMLLSSIAMTSMSYTITGSFVPVSLFLLVLSGVSILVLRSRH